MTNEPLSTSVHEPANMQEALASGRAALPFVRAGKRSMGKEYGYLNPVYVLAEAFEVLAREIEAGRP